jgi:hypothetical protein
VISGFIEAVVDLIHPEPPSNGIGKTSEVE